MLIINKIIDCNIIIFFEDLIFLNYFKNIIISKKIIKKKKIIIFFLKHNKKKINIIYSNFSKKIKFGYYVNNFYISTNLININSKILPNKIKNFELIFKILYINEKIFLTRKINFKKKKILKLKTNKIYLGIIKNVVNYGVFIDLGKYDGLLHISDIPYIKKNFKKIFIKNKIIVKLIKFDKKFKKLSLNFKKIFSKNYQNNLKINIVKCTIKKYYKSNIICSNKKYRLIFKNFYLNCKKNDIIIAYNIKKIEKNNIINFKYKLIKNKNKFIIYLIKYKINNYNLLKYKKNFYILNFKIKFSKIKDLTYYKKFICKILKNDFYKIIKLNKKFFLKIGNLFLKIKNIFCFFTINNIKKIKNSIFFFLKKY